MHCKAQSFSCCFFWYASDLEHYAAWLYNCYPVLQSALTGTHAIITKDASTAAVKTGDVEVSLYVPNLLDSLEGVSVLFYDNATGRWVLLQPLAVDPVSKTVTVNVTVDMSDLAVWDTDSECFTVETGAYKFYLGTDCESEIAGCTATVNVTADMARALEGEEFRALTRAVEEKLGKKLTTPDVGTLLGLYDYVGLPSDVIFLLVGYCCERTAQRYGPGRRPTLRQIEREGYTWARLGLMDQDRAAAYIRDRQRQREALPRLMALLRLGDRPASPSEEKYLLSWAAMGFEDAAIERAYDKTILKCKELKWPYMNKILTSWHEKGLHTLREVEDGDRPAPRRQAPQPQGAQAREDMARMERYLQRLREQSKGKEGA